MARPHVAYLCTFLDAETSRHYGFGYAQAGLNKKRGILRTLAAAGAQTSVVAPIVLHGLTYRHFRSHERVDPPTGEAVVFPTTARTVPPLNFLLVILSTILALRRIHRRRPIDVVLFYNWNLQVVLPAVYCRLFLRASMVVEYEEGLLYSGRHPVLAWTSRALEVAFGRLVDGAILTTTLLADGLRTENHVVMRGIVDRQNPGVAAFAPRTDRPPFVLMFSGQFDRIRGIDLFLEVCRELRDEPGLEIWISGQGRPAEVSRVREAVEALGAKNVEFLGFLSYADYLARLERADVLVNLQDPSHDFSRQSFPSKVIEYMAAGKVVVSSRVSDIEEIAHAGIVLADYDAASVAEAVRSIVATPARFRESQQAARTWALGHCTPEALAAPLRALLARAKGEGT